MGRVASIEVGEWTGVVLGWNPFSEEGFQTKMSSVHFPRFTEFQPEIVFNSRFLQLQSLVSH